MTGERRRSIKHASDREVVLVIAAFFALYIIVRVVIEVAA